MIINIYITFIELYIRINRGENKEEGVRFKKTTFGCKDKFSLFNQEIKKGIPILP